VGNTIILNATGAALNGTTANAMYVKPVRNARTTNIVNYNTSSGEFSYDGNITLVQGFLTITNTDLLGGQTPFGFNIYGNSGYQEPINYVRGRGTPGTPVDCESGDVLLDQRWQVAANGVTNNDIFRIDTSYGGFTTSVGAYGSYGFSALGDSANSNINFTSGNLYFYGNAIVSNNISITGNANVTGNINYTKTYGSFTSNATQTSAGANTVNYMTLNNTEDANGVSIVSNSQITLARTGIYDIQFSAQLDHDTNNTANVEIWLTKNGSAVANTNTIVTLTKDEKAIAAWDWLVNANTANDYFEIAWASSDTNVEIIATDAANTIANVAVPSLIVTIVPVGA
jgi:hypothetical protein